MIPIAVPLPPHCYVVMGLLWHWPQMPSSRRNNDSSQEGQGQRGLLQELVRPRRPNSNNPAKAALETRNKFQRKQFGLLG